MSETGPPKLHKRPSAILVLFLVLFGAGVFVYSLADGRPPERPSEQQARLRMVDQQIVARDVRSKPVIEALKLVPRHRFVPAALRGRAYEDRPLPIGHGQTISQPYIVAAMTDLARLEPNDRVLEIGTGSGYQAAVLSRVVRKVYSIEIVRPLGLQAKALLKDLGYDNVEVRIGDGYRGWPEHAPFDAILITAAPKKVPAPLLEQLAPGGRLVVPEGDDHQVLRIYERTAGGIRTTDVFGVRFVPMTGEAERVKSR